MLRCACLPCLPQAGAGWLSMTTGGLRLRCLRGGTLSKRAPVILSTLPVILSVAKNPVHRRETMRGLGCFAVLSMTTGHPPPQSSPEEVLGTRYFGGQKTRGKHCLPLMIAWTGFEPVFLNAESDKLHCKPKGCSMHWFNFEVYHICLSENSAVRFRHPRQWNADICPSFFPFVCEKQYFRCF